MNGPPAASSLLTPSLTGSRPHQLLLSGRATFFTSFFGGPVAALVVMGINLHRLGRLKTEAVSLVVGALLTLCSLVFAWAAIAQPELLGSLAPEDARRAGTLASRGRNLFGLLTWGLLYLRMRVDLRAAELTGGDFENPWKWAGVAVLCGLAINGFVVFAAALSNV